MEGDMRSSVFGTFLGGVALGIGIAALSLYTQKPAPLAASLEVMARKGQARKAREERNRFLRKRLQAMGFSDQEIDENL
jgi:hypothetical protein